MADSIMDSLIYSLNATVPVFVVIVVGYLLKRIGWINQGFIEASNKINFKVTLPALLIQDMVNNNFMEKFELGYVIFCAVATPISILTTVSYTHLDVYKRQDILISMRKNIGSWQKKFSMKMKF